MAEKTAASEDTKLQRNNWADEEDDHEDGDDVEIGGSSVAQIGHQTAAQ